MNKRDRRITRKLDGIRSSRFRNCQEIRDRKYGSILDVSGLALRPFRQKWVVGEWISGNSHQSSHSTGTACFVVYLVCIVVCTASLKEKKNTTTLGTVAGQLSSLPMTDDTLFFSASVTVSMGVNATGTLGGRRSSAHDARIEAT